MHSKYQARICRKLAFFVSMILIVVLDSPVSTLRAEPPVWPQFLGPQRNGIAPNEDLISSWPDDGPDVLWRARGGVGMSGVSVAGNRAITMWNSDSGQVIAALDAENGNLVWSTRVSANYENGMGDGPRATPTISDDHVFAFTGEGILACLTLSDGEIIWKKNVIAEAGTKPAEYGMSCSPLVVGDLVVGDLVIVTAGGDQTVIAFDAGSGEKRWSAGQGAPGYSSPALLNVDGEPQVVAFAGAGVYGIGPDDGQVLWHYPFKTAYDCNTATPISVDNHVFISSGENHGCVMLQVKKSDDTYTVSEVWESTDTKSVMRNEWQTSVFIDGHLFGLDNVGSAGPVTHLTCVNAKTGKTVWRKNRFGKSNMVAADDKLWLTTMKGEFVLVDATPDEFRELGRSKLLGKTRQAPSIAGGRAYVRDDAEVLCIKID